MSGADEGTVSVTPADFRRLEGKVDQLADVIGQLVVIEDRQTRHAAQLEKGEQRMAAFEKQQREDKAETDKELTRIDRRIDKWLHLGMGACLVVSGALQLYKLATGK